MDSLQELPLEQWPLLKEKLKALWPLHVGAYYAVESNIKCPVLREAFNFRVYCPYGDMDNGFIATSVKGETEYIIFSVDEDTNKLEEALANTKLIDWDSKVIIGIASSVTVRLMKNLKTKMAFGTFDVWGAELYYLDKNSKLFDDLQCPTDTFLAAVSPDHIKQVDDAWRFRHPESQHYLFTLASHGFSYGLYSQDKTLLAWIFINEYGYFCHLYCEPSHRKKGYGEFLLKTAINERLKQGNHSYGYVVPGNHSAIELFVKLGFRLVDVGAWMNVGR